APAFDHVHRNRVIGVFAAVAYSFLLLVVVPPAGVMSGAVSPSLVVGLADEFSAWRAGRRATNASTNPTGGGGRRPCGPSHRRRAGRAPRGGRRGGRGGAAPTRLRAAQLLT